jgi:hypothetical protein
MEWCLWLFPGFYCFPDGFVVSFENTDVGGEGCVPHFMKGGLQFVDGFVEETTVFWRVGFLPHGPGFTLDDH